MALHFQSLETLLKIPAAARWVLLKALHNREPMSIRVLSNESGREYKNVHTVARKLENAGLISRTFLSFWKCKLSGQAGC